MHLQDYVSIWEESIHWLEKNMGERFVVRAESSPDTSPRPQFLIELIDKENINEANYGIVATLNYELNQDRRLTTIVIDSIEASGKLLSIAQFTIEEGIENVLLAQYLRSYPVFLKATAHAFIS